MRLTNIIVDGAVHLAAFSDEGAADLTRAGISASMADVICGKVKLHDLKKAAEGAPAAEDFRYANLIDNPGKLVCVGLNYRSHSDKVDLKRAPTPILFSKFADALVPAGTDVELPEWETSYDYEAELVIVMGKTAWNVSEDKALDYVFGFTAGNDFSCREPQLRTSQWLIGKTMPGFGPCGPCIATRDDFGLEKGKRIKSYVNGELRQDGNTEDMIFSCAEIVSYASKYIRLEPGDLIFTGTPGGVVLEKEEKNYLKKGDTVDVVIEGIGTLTNRMV